MNETSALFWRTIPGMTNIQYPWRLLAVTTFSTAFLAGSAVYLFRSKVLVLFLVLLVLYANRNHLRPADPFRHDDLFYLQNPALSSGTTDIAHENMPIWVKNWPATWSMARVEITKGQATISGEKFLPIGSSFTIEASQEAKIRINTLYFPGWQILVDGRKQSIDFQNEKGVMEIRIQAGIHQVETKFTDTPVRQLGNSLSLISFFGLLSWGIWKGKGLMLKLKG
jgi:hypothetical protein